MTSQPEAWLRGPIAGVNAVLTPAAHALVQTMEDIERAAGQLTIDQLWKTPAGVAPVGYHLRHLAGSIDRLFTYARGESLTSAQREAVAAEKEGRRSDAATLIAALRRAIDAALTQLRETPPSSLQEARTVGRAALPTTVLGLLFHAAEHAQRHAGQIVTTAKIVRGLDGS